MSSSLLLKAELNAKARAWCSGFGPLGSENLHRWKFCSLLGYPIAVLNRSHRYFFFLMFEIEISLHVMCDRFILSFALALCTSEEGLGLFNVQKVAIRCPHLAFISENKHNSPKSVTLLCNAFLPPSFASLVCRIHLMCLGFYRACEGLLGQVLHCMKGYCCF